MVQYFLPFFFSLHSLVFSFISLLSFLRGSGQWEEDTTFFCYTVFITTVLGSCFGSWDQFLIQTSSTISHVKSQLRWHPSMPSINSVIPVSFSLSEQMELESLDSLFTFQAHPLLWQSTWRELQLKPNGLHFYSQIAHCPFLPSGTTV